MRGIHFFNFAYCELLITNGVYDAVPGAWNLIPGSHNWWIKHKRRISFHLQVFEWWITGYKHTYDICTTVYIELHQNLLYVSCLFGVYLFIYLFVIRSSKMSLKSKFFVFSFWQFLLGYYLSFILVKTQWRLSNWFSRIAFWVIAKTIKNKRIYLLCLPISLYLQVPTHFAWLHHNYLSLAF